MSGARVHQPGPCSVTCSYMTLLCTMTHKAYQSVIESLDFYGQLFTADDLDYKEAINITSIAGDKGKHAYSCEVSGAHTPLYSLLMHNYRTILMVLM